MRLTTRHLLNAFDFEAEIQQAKTSEVTKMLVRILDQMATERIDNDRLMFIGAVVGRSGHEQVDSAVVEWSRSEPGPVRDEIAAAFLWGYWKNAAQVVPAAIAEMVAALGRALERPSSSRYAMTAFAIYALIAYPKRNLPAHKAEQLRTLLLQHLARLEASGLQPGVVQELAPLRRVS